jgi:DtxR family Mn-dependent transcriptional regulator
MNRPPDHRGEAAPAHPQVAVHPEFLDQPADEILEAIWNLRELGQATLAALYAQLADSEQSSAATESRVRRMAEAGLVRLDGDALDLAGPGESRARALVRCHRLAERLLHDAFNLPPAEAERTACLMEHVLSPAAADAVCSFLGHPPTTPQGSPIPPGACCAGGGKEVKPLVVALSDLEIGTSARIVFMAQRAGKRVERLGSYGVVPGSIIRLRQKRPSYVIELEGTSLALDTDVAREIYVRREG